MNLLNTDKYYGLISKIFHWITAAALFIQIPLGFYLVDLDFGEKRITIESVHVVLGLTIFFSSARATVKVLKIEPSS